MSGTSGTRAPVRRLLPLALALLASCEGGGGGSGAPQAGAEARRTGPQPDFTITLPLDSELPLPPRHFVQMDSTEILAADPLEAVVWRIRLEGADARIEVAHRLSPAPRERIVAMAGGTRTVGVLDRRGMLTLWDPVAWTPLAHAAVHTAALERPLQMVPAGGRAFALLYREAEAGQDPSAAVRHVLRLLSFDGAEPRVLWRSPRADIVRSLYDQPALAYTGDTVLVSGELPPRVVRLPVAEPEAAHELRLVGTPPRPLSPTERTELARDIRSSPAAVRERAWVPELHPAVMAAWVDGGGMLAWAGAAGGLRLLDRYCDGAWRGTVLERDGWRELAVLPDFVLAVVEEPDAAGMRLEGFRKKRLQPQCP